MKKILCLAVAVTISIFTMGCTFNNQQSVCKHSYKNTKVRDATCTEKGIIESICEKCWDKIVAYIDCIPHEYEQGVCKECGEHELGNSNNSSSDTGSSDTSEDTSDSSGGIEQICRHDFQWSIVREANCKEEGIKEFVCVECGEAHGEPQFIQKTEKHNYVNGQCIVCGKEDENWTDFA